MDEILRSKNQRKRGTKSEDMEDMEEMTRKDDKELHETCSMIDPSLVDFGFKFEFIKQQLLQNAQRRVMMFTTWYVF